MTTSLFRRLVSLGAGAALLFTGLAISAPAATADTAPPAATPPLPKTVSADPLPTWQLTGVVWSQVVVGHTVYATGDFTKARPPGMWAGGPTEINVGHLFAYDITTGNRVTSFNHTLNAQGLAITASPDGRRVYVGGDFTTVDGQAHQHVAAFDTATGTLVSGFGAIANGQVKALAATNDTVYAGGAFASAGGSARRFLAAFAATSGSLQRWAPSADDGYVWALSLTPDASKVVIGGQFSTLNGQAANGMGAVDPSTGASRPWAASSVILDSNNGAIDSLTTDGTFIYGSGFAYGTGSRFEGSFSLNPGDGSIRWMNDCQGDTYDVEPVGQVVYTVSHTHNCTMIGDFPDTSPRTRWQHAGAYTSYPTGVNKGPDVYGWNYQGQPDATMLQWYPNLGIGTATGQYQAAWNVTSGDGYVALGGEFPTVNGKPQQGLTRYALTAAAPNKVGPTYNDTVPVRNAPPATTVAATAPGTVRIGFGAAWDMDNQRLTYRVYRDRGTAAEKLVATVTADSNFWTLPSQSVNDTSVPAGQHTYQIRITDPFGNELLSPASNPISANGTTDAYAAGVLAAGADHYWRLDETGTTVYDSAGTADGVAQSGVTRGAAGAVTGSSDKASGFSGTTSGYVGTGTAATTSPNVFTTEAWFKTTSITGGKIVGFGSKKTGGSSSYDRHVYLGNTGKVSFGVYRGGSHAITSPTSYNDGKWHLVDASLDSSGMALYVDGRLIGRDASVTAGDPYQGYWRIGGDTLGAWPAAGVSGYLKGTIDEVATYPRALTLADVAGRFRAGGGTLPNQPPKAAFTSTAQGLRAAFDGSGSTDPDGTVSSYAWTFGDGSTGTGVKPNHTYAKAGSFPVTLTVTDDRAGTGNVSHTVAVTNTAPTAAFTTVTNGLTATFDGSGSTDPDGTVNSYAWTFGDGSTGTGVKPNHTYAKAGSYPVTLTVTDNAGGSAAKTATVTVQAANAKPVAAFTSSLQDHTVSFDARASADPDGHIASYAWDFGDTTAGGTGAQPSHTYAANGTYLVKLTVTDDQGATGTVTHSLTVAGALARDDFGRTVAGGWGSADVGGTWTYSGSTSLFSVANGAGTIKMTSAGSGPAVRLPISSTDTDLSFDFALDKAPSGGGQFVRAIVRGDQSNGYLARVWVSSKNTMTLYLTTTVKGVETNLTSKVLPVTFQPGVNYSLRVQAWGSGTTNLQGKVWPTSSTEPTAWTVSATDTTASLQAAGGIAVRAYLSGSATTAPVTLSVRHVQAVKTGH